LKLVLPLLGTLLAGCFELPHDPPKAKQSLVPRTSTSTAPWIPQPNPSLPSLATPTGATETIFGVEVADPYRSLETLSPETSAWIDGESARTIRSLQEWGFSAVQSGTTPFFVNGTILEPQVAGGQIFFTKREGYQQQPLIYLTSPATPIRAVFDPAERDARLALDWYFPSPHGRYIALGTSSGGTERTTLTVLDVRTGTLRRDRIERTRWGSVAWLASEDGFYYTRYPNPGEAGYDATQEDAYFSRVFFHRLGSDPARDPMVFESADGTDFPTMSISEDDRWLVVTNFRGWFESDVWLFDRGADPRSRISAPTAERPMTPVIAHSRSMTHATVRAGHLYLLTNDGASQFRIDRVPAARAADRSARQIVIPPTDVPISAWLVASDKLVLNTIEDVHSRLYVHSLDGTRLRELELPDLGEVEGIAADPAGNELVAVFSSYTTPPSVYAFDLTTGARRLIDRISCSLDLSRYTVTRERVRSADGTMVPLTLVHSPSMVRDGNQPVLLYGYGGFADSFLPSFRTDALYWVDRGGIYAVANIRGGGEFGEAWHRGGSMENKVRSFEDFEAALRWLATSGVSRPERIAITGDSNGGLLVGAMVTRVPELFRAAVGNVGLYDMIRYTRFPPAELWVTEYGNPSVEREFRFLHDYSPYHHVSSRAYPWVLLETAEEDNRVHWSHSTKFAAALQAAQSGDSPILFFMARGAGHGTGLGGGFGLGDRYARGFTFMEKALGMR
jgi:prolyl oligopeptidase